MTKTAAIAKALLKGEVVTIMDGFRRYGVTNIPREISRQIEQKFGVEISRDKVDFTLDCGLPGWYFRYRLNHTEANLTGIEKMKDYISEFEPTNARQLIERQQTELF